MNLTVTFAVDDLLRALRARVHTVVDEIESTGRPPLRKTPSPLPDDPNRFPLRTGRDDRARR